MSKNVIVTGGRDYDDYERVRAVLDDLDIAVVAQGGASGADRLAALWAYERSKGCMTYQADWSSYGRAAGPIRNLEMLRNFGPDLIVAFPGGRGTAHMVRIAKAAGVPVVEVPA